MSADLAAVIPISRRRPATAATAAPVLPAPRLQDEGGEPFTPNGTELAAAHNYANGYITLQQFVWVVEGDGDQRRAGRVLDAYLKGNR